MTKFEFNGDAEASTPPLNGVVLGRHVSGDYALPVEGGSAIWPLRVADPKEDESGDEGVEPSEPGDEDAEALIDDDEDAEAPVSNMEHVAILGTTGSGKSSTAWTIFDGAARVDPDAQIIFIDGNADRAMAQLFGAAMIATGRSPKFFPRQRFNAWPGSDWQPIYNRLLEVIPFAEFGDGAFYTDASSVILQLACRLNGRPPRSTKDLFDRLDYNVLMAACGRDEMKGIKEKHVDELYMRVKAVCAHFGKAMDGNWSFGDVDSAYFGLSALVLGKSAVVTMRMLLSQLSYYIEHEKPRGRRCIVIIDEFASLAGGVSIGAFIEHARKLGVCVILMSQTVPGMGDPVQIARVLDNSGLLLVHSTPEWSEIERLIGLEITPELTLRTGNDLGADLDMLRLVEKPKVNRDELLALPTGRVWAFRNNQAMQIQIERPSKHDYPKKFRLPKAEELFEPLSLGPDVSDDEVVAVPGYLTGEPRKAGFHGADFSIPGADDAPSSDENSDDPAAD